MDSIHRSGRGSFDAILQYDPEAGTFVHLHLLAIDDDSFVPDLPIITVIYITNCGNVTIKFARKNELLKVRLEGMDVDLTVDDPDTTGLVRYHCDIAESVLNEFEHTFQVFICDKFPVNCWTSTEEREVRLFTFYDFVLQVDGKLNDQHMGKICSTIQYPYDPPREDRRSATPLRQLLDG